MLAKVGILGIDVYFTQIFIKLLRFHTSQGKDHYAIGKKVKKCCCVTLVNQSTNRCTLCFAVILTAMHLIDSILSLSCALADLMIFEAKSDPSRNIHGWKYFLFTARLVRNQIDLITGLAFLILAYSVGKKLLEKKERVSSERIHASPNSVQTGSSSKSNRSDKYIETAKI
jgi:hypothetical protein